MNDPLQPATPAADTGLPVDIGNTTLQELPWQRIVSVQPFTGPPVTEQDAAPERLWSPLGLTLPATGHYTTNADGVVLAWAGRGTWFVIGADRLTAAAAGGLDEPVGSKESREALAAVATLTDQSDAWCGLALQGPDAIAVLARLVPVDLCADPAGNLAIRTLLGHLPLLLLKIDEHSFRLYTFRSMARDAVQELTHAMRLVAARQASA